jgi:hypothetical protein
MNWIRKAASYKEAFRKGLMIGAGLLTLFLLLRLFPTDFFSKYVGILCEWVASMGIWAPFILGIIDAVGVAICFPLTLAFELAAGFLFGVTAGFVSLTSNPQFHALNLYYKANTNQPLLDVQEHRHFYREDYWSRRCPYSWQNPPQSMGTEHLEELSTLVRHLHGHGQGYIQASSDASFITCTELGQQLWPRFDTYIP